MLVDKVRKDLQEATKARETERMGALRMLVSALEYLEKSGKQGEAEEMAIVKSEVKKRKEAMAAYEKVGEKERAQGEQKELEVIEVYMPEQVSEDEIKVVVERLVGEMGKDVNRGQLIGRVIGEVGKDKTDGSVVSKVIDEVLK